MKLGLTLGLPLLVFGGGELALRATGFRQARLDPVVVWNTEEDRELRGSAGLHIFDSHQLWAPRPGAPVPGFEGERIQAGGIRGPGFEERPETLRVAVMGESNAFGLGLAERDTLSAQLEAELRARGVDADVVNAGVIGHTLRQGLERYRQVVRELEPDIVLATYGVSNEHHPALPLSDDEKVLRFGKQAAPLGRAARWLRHNVRLLHGLDYVRLQRQGGAVRVEEARRELLVRQAEGDFGSESWGGVRRVPPERFLALWHELRSEVERDGARLIPVSLPRKRPMEHESPVLLQYSAALGRFVQDTGAPLVNLRRELLRCWAAGEEPGDVFLPHDSWHLNAEGHRRLAALAADVLLAGSARDVEDAAPQR